MDNLDPAVSKAAYRKMNMRIVAIMARTMPPEKWAELQEDIAEHGPLDDSEKDYWSAQGMKARADEIAAGKASMTTEDRVKTALDSVNNKTPLIARLRAGKVH